MATQCRSPVQLEDLPEVLTALDLVKLGFGSRNHVYEDVRHGGILADAAFRVGGKLLFSKRGVVRILDRETAV